MGRTRNKTHAEGPGLFIDPSGQLELLEKSVEQRVQEARKVECLGFIFENDEARRAYFLEKLREKLKDPGFRKIEGFPIGENEVILRLSDPPYYTACPNPFLGDFVKHYGKPYDPSVPYSREPFAADVSEGKNDPIYNAHSYHTKVPHKAIMRYILHYTEPGDIVFDGFCGTGMTGVAAQLCGDRKAVQELGYRVLTDGTILDQEGKPFSKLGSRRALLTDLSPAATFIAYNYTTPVNVTEFKREAQKILAAVEKECGWMYLTLHQPKPEQVQKATFLLQSVGSDLKAQDTKLPWGRINYTVWSDVFVCSECTHELIFWDVAVDKKAGKMNEEFPCPHCNVQVTKRDLDRAWETNFDTAINQTIRQTKQVPVLINYSVGNERREKIPDVFDLSLIEKIETINILSGCPTDQIPRGEKTGDPYSVGITHAHHFYTKRNAQTLATFAAQASKSKFHQVLAYCLSGALPELIKSARLRIGAYFHGGRGSVSAGVSGTLYIPSLSVEKRVLFGIINRVNTIARVCLHDIDPHFPRISTQSSNEFLLNDEALDYIFIDPPFGGNLMYSELNFLWESWLKIFTNNKPEAIENRVQGKNLLEYQNLMARCFREFYRILKPGRWMTVEFHNSKNSVWNAIQEALQHAGFVIADVRTLDKKQGTFNQVAGGGAVKQDLVISAYKPNSGLEDRFKLEAGTEAGAWDFVKTHLRQLPIFVQDKESRAEVVAERMGYLLYDRMVAFHVQRGVTVPLSAAEFYAGLKQRFPERDSMYFLPEQVAEYDRRRMSAKELLQLELAPSDESSAIQWLRQQLTRKPQTFQELHSQFLRAIAGWERYEKPLELSDLLKENFFCHDSAGPIPSQLVSWMKQSVDLRDMIRSELASGHATEEGGALLTRHPSLVTRAKDHWYIPDANKAQDLEKFRERALFKEFDEYRDAKQKKLKVFRLEAVRAGFKKAWQEKDYRTIIDVAQKIPENVLQEDPKLIMWYDQAMTRTGTE